VTWSLLGLHQKPIGIMNRNGYYDHLLAFLDHAVDEEFLRPRHRALVVAATSPAEVVDMVLGRAVVDGAVVDGAVVDGVVVDGGRGTGPPSAMPRP